MNAGDVSTGNKVRGSNCSSKTSWSLKSCLGRCKQTRITGCCASCEPASLRATTTARRIVVLSSTIRAMIRATKIASISSGTSTATDTAPLIVAHHDTARRLEPRSLLAETRSLAAVEQSVATNASSPTSSSGCPISSAVPSRPNTCRAASCITGTVTPYISRALSATGLSTVAKACSCTSVGPRKPEVRSSVSGTPCRSAVEISARLKARVKTPGVNKIIRAPTSTLTTSNRCWGSWSTSQSM
mmetsp:Transcript_101005/g.231655  ORF Transcript_101005/g.231655 Transcript_101005/m.231655 type:complete len:244 (-) Transcript_101005:915-1646(-)